MSGVLTAVRTWGRTVKFSHTLLALPFALSGATLAAAESGVTGRQLFWIVLAMIGARNAAMGWNRLADQEYDARNPRTSSRELPAGRLSRRAVCVFTLLLSALFSVAAFQLSPLCGWLSPVALAVVLGYSYTKRFTWASHLALGLALALAPLGGWLAVRGSFAPVAWLLAGGVLLWVAGFDVIYACQDVEFDRSFGLHSIPARVGVGPALLAARALHGAALGLLAAVGWAGGLPAIYWVGWTAIAALLVWEHRLVRADNLEKLGVAFFNMNAAISALYFATILAATLL